MARRLEETRGEREKDSGREREREMRKREGDGRDGYLMSQN